MFIPKFTLMSHICNGKDLYSLHSPASAGRLSRNRSSGAVIYDSTFPNLCAAEYDRLLRLFPRRGYGTLEFSFRLTCSL